MVPTRRGRIFDEQSGADVVGARPFHADLGDPCPDCGAWHGIPPLTNLIPGVPCSHDRNRPCGICGGPVGDLSIAGPEICGDCAAAHAEPPARESRQIEGPTERVPIWRQQLRNLWSKDLPLGLKFAVMFALGAELGFSVAAYGPRWARPTQNIVDQNANRMSASAFATVDDMGSSRESSRPNGDAATKDAKTGGAEQSEATSPSGSVPMPTVSDRAPASAIEEPADADRANLNARRSLPGDSPLPPSPQGTQPASQEARLRQEFERFVTGRQQGSTSPQDSETLFVEFKNSLANGSAGTSAPPSASKESMRRAEIWQALDTTNLHELASATSAVIGEVGKGSTFRVISRSVDGKWLKIETRDGLTGYYWAARAREKR
jgi:hypothetical protein